MFINEKCSIDDCHMLKILDVHGANIYMGIEIQDKEI